MSAVVRGRWGATTALATFAAACVVVLGRVGGDARWLGALGRAVVQEGIPDGVPYADAASSGWHNVPVLAELAFHALMTLGGDDALLVAQAGAVVAALLVLAGDARRGGASDRVTASLLLVVGFGCVASLLVARLQLFSLALFPLELALLRAETRDPTRRVWLLVPLLALWSNLHGAALLGLLVAASYLLVHRFRSRRVEAVAVAVAASLSLCLTPALAATPAYYLGVLHNEQARQHLGLWARPSWRSPFDVLLLLAVLLLLWGVLAARPAAWQLVALAGLAGLTLGAWRNGVWLLLMASVPAAVGWQRRLDSRRRGRPEWTPVSALLWTAAAAVAAVGLVHGPLVSRPSSYVVDLAVRAASGGPVVADGTFAEQVAVAGGRIWVGDPIDAFSPQEQRRYVRWVVTGDVGSLPSQGAVALTVADGPADRALAGDPDFRLVARDHAGAVYVRTTGGSAAAR